MLQVFDLMELNHGTTCRPSKELLKNAAKARIRRMIAMKKRRTDLSVPPLVREQWEKGTNEKNDMAQLLMDSNWDKDRICITFNLYNASCMMMIGDGSVICFWHVYVWYLVLRTFSSPNWNWLWRRSWRSRSPETKDGLVKAISRMTWSGQRVRLNKKVPPIFQHSVVHDSTSLRDSLNISTLVPPEDPHCRGQEVLRTVTEDTHQAGLQVWTIMNYQLISNHCCPCQVQPIWWPVGILGGCQWDCRAYRE